MVSPVRVILNNKVLHQYLQLRTFWAHSESGNFRKDPTKYHAFKPNLKNYKTA
jgi:hypothetical protein